MCLEAGIDRATNWLRQFSSVAEQRPDLGVDPGSIPQDWHHRRSLRTPAFFWTPNRGARRFRAVPFLKRSLEIIIAALALLILSPVIATVGVLVALKLGRPILFRQGRIGLGGKPFTLIKFRSMRDGPEPDDERLTRFGALLRRTSLDELPSLWNMLRGDMTIVGPRPLLLAYLSRFSPEQARRHEVKPGLTGWAQIKGRNAVDWPERLEMDVWYVDNRSALLDMRIIVATIPMLLRGAGIAAPGRATMSEFGT